MFGQCACRCRDQRVEHGRHGVQCRHRFPAHQIDEVGGIAVPLGVGDDDRTTGDGGDPELPHGQVEGGGSLEQNPVRAVQTVVGALPEQLVDDGGMADRDALGAAGGSGGEDNVRGVRGPQRRMSIAVGDGRVRDLLVEQSLIGVDE